MCHVHNERGARKLEGVRSMDKGFWDFNLSDPGTLWFWVFLPISIFVWLFKQF
jgi:hypothetical protein